MYRSELIKLCDPLKPEEALEHLKELQEALEDSTIGRILSAWGQPEDLQAVTIGVKVFEAVLPGDPGMSLEEHRHRGLGRG